MSIDLWLDGGPLDRDERAPRGGWDHAEDVAEARKIVRDFTGWIVSGPTGLRYVADIATPLYHLGISPTLAAKLIFDIQKPPQTRGDIEDAVAQLYSAIIGRPGMRSRAEPRADEWIAPDDDDDSWLEGGPAVWPKPLQYDGKQHNARLAEHFMAERPAKLASSDGVLYTLDESMVWRAISEQELAAEIRKTDPALTLDTRRLLAMVQSIHVERFTTARPFDWLDAPADAPSPLDLVLFRNGIVDAESGDLMPHDGRFFATGLPAFDFDADATCPLWIEKLQEWLHPSFHLTLQEFMGYLLTADTRYEVILAMIGAQRGGKGTISHVMRGLVGPEHHISRTMHELTGDFGLEGCTDKRVIIIPDAHSAEVSRRGAALERIKSISGRDELSVNRKNKTIVTTLIPAKIVLVANQHPKFLDESGALAARELPLIFDRSFRGKEDRDLRSKLDDELPGIANWALAGLKRLRSNGGRFTIGERGRAAARELAESQSPALRFANDCLIVTGNPEDYVPLATIFMAYDDWSTYSEGLSAREKRNRNDLKSDLIAALGTRGVSHERRRWHDPRKPKIGKGVIRRGFFGVEMKPRT